MNFSNAYTVIHACMHSYTSTLETSIDDCCSTMQTCDPLASKLSDRCMYVHVTDRNIQISMYIIRMHSHTNEVPYIDSGNIPVI